MAKKPCLDCIDKYEKSKQRKRNAKKRQKQKEEAMKPTPIIYNVPRGSDRFIPPTGSLGSSPQNLTDLLAVLRVNEALKQQTNTPTLDTLERTPTASKTRPKTANEAISQVAENYVDIAKAIPQIVKQTLAGTIGVPFSFIGSEPTEMPQRLERTLERTQKSKSRPKTANEATSDSLDLFVDTTRTGPSLVRDIATQLPRDITTTATAPFRFAGEIASSAASAAAAPFKFVGGVLSAAGAAAAAAAEPEPSLQRTAPATGGNTPAIQFIAGTGRVLESSPVEQGANPPPSVFTATPPPANLIDDLQRGGLSQEQRRVADLLASPTPRFVPKQTAELVGQPPQLIPESEVADALGGEQTILDLALRPQVDAPLVPDPLALYPEGESLLSPEEEDSFVDAEGGEEPVVVEGEPEPQLSPELPLVEVPPSFETSASLVDGKGAEDLPLTPASIVQGEGSLSPRTLTRQTTEELAKSIEDVDLPDVSALQLQKEYDKQKREEEADRRREAQLARIVDAEERAVRRAQIEEGKRLKAEQKQQEKEERDKKKAEAELGKRVEKRTPSQLQIAGLTRRDVANTPRLETFFGGAGLNTRFQQQRSASGLTQPVTAAEEPQQITFTQPTAERTFSVEPIGKITLPFSQFEGGGV